MSVYVTQVYSSYIFSPEETSLKGYLKLNSLRNIISSLPTLLQLWANLWNTTYLLTSS